MLKTTDVYRKKHSKTKQLLNNTTKSHNQEDNVHHPQHIYSINNETTKEEIISQYKEDNALGLDETQNQLIERITCKVVDNELESNNNNESDSRSRALNENIIQSCKDKEKQKIDCSIYVTTKHYKEDIVRKDINTRKGNIKENDTSRNKVTIHTREQAVKVQKGKHKPTNINKSTMRNMVDIWDNNKLDQEKKEDMFKHILDNNTMENESEQLKSRHESKEKRTNKFSKDDKSRNKLDIAKKLGYEVEYNNKVYDIFEKCITKDTDRNFNSVNIIRITDKKSRNQNDYNI